MKISIGTTIADYELFLKIKSLPSYRFIGRTAEFPDCYAGQLGLSGSRKHDADYRPLAGLFDYQRDIARLAIARRKFAVFADCGLGKTLIMLEFARHCAAAIGAFRRVLLVSPLMVIDQTIDECRKFYRDSGSADFGIEQVKAKDLDRWLGESGPFVGITNYEALTDEVKPGRLGALILDESSSLKSMYGKHAGECIRIGKGLDWKLCLTGTPAPNDRIEFANHAVFLDAFPTINSFLARFFVNRGQTQERWEIKPHAIEPFYRALSHWSIFLTNPATYGWADNVEAVPPIKVHIHDVDLTAEQKQIVGERMGTLFACDIGGITNRSALSQIAKGNYKGREIASHKPEFIRNLVTEWPGESTIIWCLYNDEQDALERLFPGAASITGSTPHEKRMALIADFQAGRRKTLISKGKILGYGLNLQVATRQVFSSLVDSYETFYQCVKRSNRYGSTMPLNVHIPITDVEAPMVDTVLRKAARIQHDTEIQEQLFVTQYRRRSHVS
jgi:superfamily II DNA or RNA helicase